jgi:DNA (cytosine-5)-methyltransferase 1
MLRIGSLCTGYGGLDLAVKAETIWCAEIDKYASKVIAERFDIPNAGNIKEIRWAMMPEIDILTAGYPCQPFSNAGKRKGTNDSRHIWPHIEKAISILNPRLVILENVRGHLTLGFKEVLKGLAEIGYDAKWILVRASDAGAPHKRERIFIMAQPSNPNGLRNNMGKKPEDSKYGESQQGIEFGQMGASINSSNQLESHNRQVQKLGGRFITRSEMQLQTPPNPLDVDGKLNAEFVEYMMGLPKGWVTDVGLSRAQQIKILGNGVVPQQAKLALELLTAVDNYVE